MRKKYMLIGVGIVVGALLSSVVFVLAGNPNSLSVPGATNSFTVEDIYNRLFTGADGAQSTFTEPGVVPGTGTMHTLNEIMATAPAKDAAGATTANVMAGQPFWGLTGGQWGLQIGALPTQTLSDSSTTVAAGYYAATTLDAVDADLAAGNIVSDTVIFGIVGTYPWAGVPKTGAGDIGGYVEQAGEDGHASMRKGVPWPNPRFTDNGDGTVTDNLTGLIWLQDANCFGVQAWANALSSANALADPACGLGDSSTAGQWRLPNVRELHSLVHYGFTNPAVPNTAGTGKWTTNGAPFNNVVPGGVNNWWSSTTLAGDTTAAWYVTLGNGNVRNVAKTTASRVWPVRGP